MRGTIFFLVIAIITLVFLFNLVRSRRLREKYVALWMLVGLVIIVLALFPNLLGWLATLVGVAVPSNLLFALAILMLLGVTIQLSLEISHAEEKTRTLAEHVAILNLQMRQLSGEPTAPLVLPNPDDELTQPLVDPSLLESQPTQTPPESPTPRA